MSIKKLKPLGDRLIVEPTVVAQKVQSRLQAADAVLALANVAPRECVAIKELFDQGKLDEARALHFKLMPVGRAVTSQFGIGGLKAALDLLGYYGGQPRSPLSYPHPEEVEEIRGILSQAELLT